jgi:hypothetical protein
MTEWTPTCEALPPVGALCVGIYEDAGSGEPIVQVVRLTADHDRAAAVWMLHDNGAWIDAFAPRLWARLPAIPDEWVSPCPVGGEIVHYEANVCSCGRVGKVTP